MRKMALAAAALLLLLAETAGAAEIRGRIIYKDTLYGVLTGALLGGAIMVFSDEPGDHVEYVAYGAAAGALAGAVFGFYEATAVAEVKDGNLYLALPTLRTSRRDGGYVTNFDLFRMGF